MSQFSPEPKPAWNRLPRPFVYVLTICAAIMLLVSGLESGLSAIGRVGVFMGVPSRLSQVETENREHSAKITSIQRDISDLKNEVRSGNEMVMREVRKIGDDIGGVKAAADQMQRSVNEATTLALRSTEKAQNAFNEADSARQEINDLRVDVAKQSK